MPGYHKLILKIVVVESELLSWACKVDVIIQIKIILIIDLNCFI